MKISIVIPSNNEAGYVEKLTDYIRGNSNPNNIEEIIIVESFQTKHIVKVAEKSHAKLYYNLFCNVNSQMEMGAFEAKGEIIYFIKPGCTPPTGFDERIIKYVNEKCVMASFDFVIEPTDNFFLKYYKKICSLFFTNAIESNTFFILKKLYYETNALKQLQTQIKN